METRVTQIIENCFLGATGGVGLLLGFVSQQSYGLVEIFWFFACSFKITLTKDGFHFGKSLLLTGLWPFESCQRFLSCHFCSTHIINFGAKLQNIRLFSKFWTGIFVVFWEIFEEWFKRISLSEKVDNGSRCFLTRLLQKPIIKLSLTPAVLGGEYGGLRRIFGGFAAAIGGRSYTR